MKHTLTLAVLLLGTLAPLFPCRSDSRDEPAPWYGAESVPGCRGTVNTVSPYRTLVPIACSSLISTLAEFQAIRAVPVTVGPGAVLLVGKGSDLSLVRFPDGSKPTRVSVPLLPVPSKVRTAAPGPSGHYLLFGHSELDSPLHIWRFKCTSNCRQISHFGARGRSCGELKLTGPSCKAYEDAVQIAAEESERLRCMTTNSGCFVSFMAEGTAGQDKAAETPPVEHSPVVPVQVADRLGFSIENAGTVSPALFVFFDTGQCGRTRRPPLEFEMANLQPLSGGFLTLVGARPRMRPSKATPRPRAVRGADYVMLVRFSEDGVPLGHPVGVVFNRAAAHGWMGACTRQRCLLTACRVGLCSIRVISLPELQTPLPDAAPAGGCR